MNEPFRRVDTRRGSTEIVAMGKLVEARAAELRVGTPAVVRPTALRAVRRMKELYEVDCLVRVTLYTPNVDKTPSRSQGSICCGGCPIVSTGVAL
jgi:hypothetical protein